MENLRFPICSALLCSALLCSALLCSARLSLSLSLSLFICTLYGAWCKNITAAVCDLLKYSNLIFAFKHLILPPIATSHRYGWWLTLGMAVACVCEAALDATKEQFDPENSTIHWLSIAEDMLDHIQTNDEAQEEEDCYEASFVLPEFHGLMPPPFDMTVLQAVSKWQTRLESHVVSPPSCEPSWVLSSDFGVILSLVIILRAFLRSLWGPLGLHHWSWSPLGTCEHS